MLPVFAQQKEWFTSTKKFGRGIKKKVRGFKFLPSEKEW
jgi:hypothetical protein